MGQGGPQPPGERFGARQQDVGVLPAPGATILSALAARPRLPTVTHEGFFFPLPCSPTAASSVDVFPAQTNPVWLEQNTSCCRRINPFCTWGTRPQTSASKECCSLPPAPRPGCLYQKGLGALQGGWSGWENAALPQNQVKSRNQLAGKAQHPERCPSRQTGSAPAPPRSAWENSSQGLSPATNNSPLVPLPTFEAR